MGPLSGKVAIVTGASRGIGRAIALGLARDGCAVVIAAKSVESTEKLPGSIHTVAQEVESLGTEALTVAVDVRDAEQSMASRKGRSAFGHIDILINNAGAPVVAAVAGDAGEAFRPGARRERPPAFLQPGRSACSMIERRLGHIINMSPPWTSAWCRAASPTASPARHDAAVVWAGGRVRGNTTSR